MIAAILLIGLILILAAIEWWNKLDTIQKLVIGAIACFIVVALLAPYWKEILALLILAIVAIISIVYLVTRKTSSNY